MKLIPSQRASIESAAGGSTVRARVPAEVARMAAGLPPVDEDEATDRMAAARAAKAAKKG